MADKLAGEFETGFSGFGGHPITAIRDLPRGVLTRLTALGITDSEQLIALAALPDTRQELVRALGLSQQRLAGLIESAERVVRPVYTNRLATPGEADLELGALEPTPEMLQEALSLPFALEEAVAALPPAVNLVKKMPPARDQAGRGTCVAFALTALHEYYQRERGDPQDFSEQHLYYETKQVDGNPFACGTWQTKAVVALASFGQCRETLWAYNPNPPCNNHGNPPPTARTDGATFKLRTQQIQPRDSNRIKAFLAQGWPVTISIPVWNSWYGSAETRRSGRITMRIGTEASPGGHAVILVGYQDDDSVPGGGYFILRNSWGPTKWGSECPYGAGHGTIPYQYITNDNREAYTLATAPEPRPRPKPIPSRPTPRPPGPPLGTGIDDLRLAGHLLRSFLEGIIKK